MFEGRQALSLCPRLAPSTVFREWHVKEMLIGSRGISRASKGPTPPPGASRHRETSNKCNADAERNRHVISRYVYYSNRRRFRRPTLFGPPWAAQVFANKNRHTTSVIRCPCTRLIRVPIPQRDTGSVFTVFIRASLTCTVV